MQIFALQIAGEASCILANRIGAELGQLFGFALATLLAIRRLSLVWGLERRVLLLIRVFRAQTFHEALDLRPQIFTRQRARKLRDLIRRRIQAQGCQLHRVRLAGLLRRHRNGFDDARGWLGASERGAGARRSSFVWRLQRSYGRLRRLDPRQLRVDRRRLRLDRRQLRVDRRRFRLDRRRLRLDRRQLRLDRRQLRLDQRRLRLDLRRLRLDRRQLRLDRRRLRLDRRRLRLDRRQLRLDQRQLRLDLRRFRLDLRRLRLDLRRLRLDRRQLRLDRQEQPGACEAGVEAGIVSGEKVLPRPTRTRAFRQFVIRRRGDVG